MKEQSFPQIKNVVEGEIFVGKLQKNFFRSLLHYSLFSSHSRSAAALITFSSCFDVDEAKWISERCRVENIYHSKMLFTLLLDYTRQSVVVYEGRAYRRGKGKRVSGEKREATWWGFGIFGSDLNVECEPTKTCSACIHNVFRESRVLAEHSEGRVESNVIRGKKERKERRSNQIHVKQRGKSSSRGRRWRQNEMIWRRFVSQKNIWKFFSVGLLWWWRPTTAWWLTLRSGEAESDSRRLRSFEFIFIFTNTMWVASPRVSSHEIFSFFFFFIFLLRFSLSSHWAAAAHSKRRKNKQSDVDVVLRSLRLNLKPLCCEWLESASFE